MCGWCLTCLPMIPNNFEQRDFLFAKSGYEIILQLENGNQNCKKYYETVCLLDFTPANDKHFN